MSARVRVRCPAKVNPVLVVIGPREDGFHDLDLEFQALALSDRLTIEIGERPSFEVVGPAAAGVPLAGNLVLAAADAVRRAAGLAPVPLRFGLEKHVPAAAGLGGGSSDAAGALLGVTRLLDARLEDHVLAELALELGSDVPFFLRGGRQRGQGRGELLEDLPERPQRAVLLLRPRRPLSTARVFGEHRRGRQDASETPSAAGLTTRKTGISFPLSAWWKRGEVLVRNDLWEAAAGLAPELPGLCAGLEAALPEAAVGLSGSGPTLFALCPPELSETRLRTAEAELRGPDVEVLRTRTLGRAELEATRFEAGRGGAVG